MRWWLACVWLVACDGRTIADGGTDAGLLPDATALDAGPDASADAAVDAASASDDAGRDAGGDVCGDGVFGPTELCEVAITSGPGACPIDCADTDACTSDRVEGTACQSSCAHEAITLCTSGDGCCPAGCDRRDFDCVTCDAHVPGDYATIGAAIAAATAPSTICIAAGRYVENLMLRPHVHLQGVGPATIVAGHVSVRNLIDPDPTPTELRDLRIEYDGAEAIHVCATAPQCPERLVLGTSALALALRRVELRGDSTGTTYCAEIDLLGGTFRLVVEDSVCASERGLRVVGAVPPTAPIDPEITIERTRFEPGAVSTWTYASVEALYWAEGGACGGATAPAGTHARVLVRNNEFLRSHYDSIYLTQCLALSPADAAASGIEITHNTFVVDSGVAGDLAYSIWNNTGSDGFGPRLSVYNNLYYRSNANPIRGLAPDDLAGDLRVTVDPFLDEPAGDLRLAPGSPAIDRADPAHVPTDLTGAPRPVDGDGDGTAVGDVGAHEHVPGPG